MPFPIRATIGKLGVMNRAELQSLAVIPAIVLLGAGIAWAGSQGGVQVSGIPLFALCGVLAFTINWVAFVPSYLFRTERYFDVSGSITYLALVLSALTLRGEADSRAVLLGVLVAGWAVRLGSFLFGRILRAGADRRFDALKASLPRFLMTWTLQGLWVLLTLSCALAAMTATRAKRLEAFAAVGTIVWAVGFAIRGRGRPAEEASLPRRPGEPRSLHPVGTLGLVPTPQLLRGDHPVERHCRDRPAGPGGLAVRDVGFPSLRLRPAHAHQRNPPLDDRADKKWGADPEYRAYRDRTPVLLPRPPARP